MDSIWSSPELPVRPKDTKKQSAQVLANVLIHVLCVCPRRICGDALIYSHDTQARNSPSLPPGSKAVTLEELERGYLTPSPPPTSSTASQSHTSPQPPNLAQPGTAPPPGITAPTGPSLLMGPFPPPMPMGQIPPMGIRVSTLRQVL